MLVIGLSNGKNNYLLCTYLGAFKEEKSLRKILLTTLFSNTGLSYAAGHHFGFLSSKKNTIAKKQRLLAVYTVFDIQM